MQWNVIPYYPWKLLPGQKAGQVATAVSEEQPLAGRDMIEEQLIFHSPILFIMQRPLLDLVSDNFSNQEICDKAENISHASQSSRQNTQWGIGLTMNAATSLSAARKPKTEVMMNIRLSSHLQT